MVSTLGAGGMGEVYRATDTSLGRQVAIKVLRESVATDPDRLARFEREARTLAALNHPNIAQIYGLERSGTTPALVMELVEGETLADRIARGPIPLDEALPIAKQIAEALETAHEQGIIHRDLKPANIKVRYDGTVKVLDFGLAKLAESVAAPTSNSAALSMSPTITSPAMMTGVGVLLGTAAYMSPEQAKGRPVDKRGDIWAFGCVLYEMLTGSRAFEGQSVTETLARVIEREPDLSTLPSGTPSPVMRLLRRALTKEPAMRLPDIADARIEIHETTKTGRDPRACVGAAAVSRRHAVLFTIAPANGSIDNGELAVLDLRTGTQKVLLRGGSHAHYVPSGHIVYAVAGTLRAVGFDLDQLEVRGTPVPVLPQLVTTAAGAADFEVSANGTLVYVPAAPLRPWRDAGSYGSIGTGARRQLRRRNARTSIPGCRRTGRAWRSVSAISRLTSGCGTFAARR